MACGATDLVDWTVSAWGFYTDPVSLAPRFDISTGNLPGWQRPSDHDQARAYRANVLSSLEQGSCKAMAQTVAAGRLADGAPLVQRLDPASADVGEIPIASPTPLQHADLCVPRHWEGLAGPSRPLVAQLLRQPFRKQRAPVLSAFSVAYGEFPALEIKLLRPQLQGHQLPPVSARPAGVEACGLAPAPPD